MKDIGLSIGFGGELFFLGNYNKGWNKIPDVYRTKKNFETFCMLNYMCCDAVTMFLDEIEKLK
jgi:hypothetical protein